jgi:hypothetical protein
VIFPVEKDNLNSIYAERVATLAMGQPLLLKTLAFMNTVTNRN